MTDKELSFEQALKKLEQIVGEMESQELPLEKAVARFEEGTRLARLCEKKLDEVEKKVTLLMADDTGEIREVPFAGLSEDTPTPSKD